VATAGAKPEVELPEPEQLKILVAAKLLRLQRVAVELLLVSLMKPAYRRSSGPVLDQVDLQKQSGARDAVDDVPQQRAWLEANLNYRLPNADCQPPRWQAWQLRRAGQTRNFLVNSSILLPKKFFSKVHHYPLVRPNMTLSAHHMGSTVKNPSFSDGLIVSLVLLSSN